MGRRQRANPSSPMQMPTNAPRSPDGPRPFAPATRRTQHGIIQTRLVVTPAGDRYEQEADRVANSVVSRLPALRAERGTAEVAQRQAVVQLQAPTGGAPVDSAVEAGLTAARSGGSPLNSTLRAPLESAFGHDFSAVRLHTSSQADSLNRSLSARAFTTGSDIFFRQGEYQPSSSAGQQLLAHELTHVVQQGGGAGAAQRAVVQRKGKKEIKWASASQVVPSGEGALGGVMFLTVGGETYVVKPGEGSPANVLFAEEILETVGGAQTSESRPVTPDMPEFAGLKAALTNRGLVPALKQARWDDMQGFYTGAAYFMVQKSMKAPDLGTKANPASENAEFSDVYKDDPLKILEDKKYLSNIGRILVADTLLGNADRIEQMNGGNFFVLGNSKVGAIDNESFFPSMAKVEAYSKTGQGETIADKNKSIDEIWVSYLISGQSAIHKQAPMSNVEGIMGGIDRSIRYSFASIFFKDPTIGMKADDPNYNRLKTEYQARVKTLADAGYGDPTDLAKGATNFAAPAWQAVKNAILEGYNAGVEALQKNLSGSKGKSLLKRFAELKQKYGADDVGMNEGAFEVRSAYMLAKADGQDDDKAKAVAVEKAKAAVAMSDKLTRVVSYGKGKSIISAAHEASLKLIASELSADQQDAIISVRPYSDKKLLNARDAGRDDKFEQLRAQLVKQFVQAYDREVSVTAQAAPKDPQGKQISLTAQQKLAASATKAYTDAVAEAKLLEKTFTGVIGDNGYTLAVWRRYNVV